MKHNARKSGVDGEAEATLHALQAHDAKGIDNRLLQAAESPRGVVANHHVMLPLGLLGRRVEEGQLRPMEQDEGEIVV